MHVVLDWDGKDVARFIEAIGTFRHEENRLQISSPYTDKPVIANDYHDLYAILPPPNPNRIPYNEEIPHDQYEQMIRRFIQSKEMADYLVCLPQSRAQLVDTIAMSPVPMREKLAALEELAVREDVFRDILDDLCESENLSTHTLPPSMDYFLRCNRSFVVCANAIRNALDALELAEGEILILAEKAYSKDPDTHGGAFGYWGFAPYLSYRAVKEYVSEELAELDDEERDEVLFWYVLEKWVPSQDGNMREQYRYTFIDDEPVFFSYGGSRKNDADDIGERLWGSESSRFGFPNHIDLPVPYKPGDIVRFDCRPFAPIRYACLFDFWGYGYGEIAALYRNDKGLWDERSVGYSSCMDNAGYMSLLYRVEKADASELPAENALLCRVQDFVAGDNKRGEALWKVLYETMKNEWTDEEIDQAMRAAEKELQ